MKILIADYSGHPFQVQLSKELAKRGHVVKHFYCSSFKSPRGNMDDAGISSFEVIPISLERQVDKANFLKRRSADILFGKKLKNHIVDFDPDRVVLSNMPMDSLPIVTKYCLKNEIPFIFWLQDIYYFAIKNVVSKKIPIIGSFIAFFYKRIELSAIKRAAHTICITDSFIPYLNKWGVAKESCSVIPNWAPIDELPIIDKENQWSVDNRLNDKKVVLYSGTLGFKHNPDLLLKLAKQLDSIENAILLVISEGPVVDYLARQALSQQIESMKILPFQDFDVFPQVLGTADVLIGVLEKEAGKFSVPSKVLSYLTSNKAIVLSVPQDNLSSTIIRENEAGFSFPPDDEKSFVKKTKTLLFDEKARKRLGKNGRKYADNHFQINNIANQFEEILKKIKK